MGNRPKWPVVAGLALILGSHGGAGLAAPEVATIQVPDEVRVPARKVVTASIAVTITPGFHVQANPASEENLIPLTLTLPPHNGIAVGRPIYPAPKRHRLEGSNQDLRVYDGTFHIRLALAAMSRSEGGELRGTIRYQACDHRTCLPPRSVPIALKVRVVQ
jgi:DsbC/DsbD-like thiol-disulfide interchange protein